MPTSEDQKPLVLRLAEHALSCAFEGKSQLVKPAAVTDAVNQVALQLQLTEKQVRSMLYEIPRDPDKNLGYVQWREWVPRAALAMLGGSNAEVLRVEARAAQRKAARTLDALLETVNKGALHNLDVVGLTAALEEMFRQADKDDSGALDQEEFRTMMLSSGMGLSEREISRLIDATMRGSSTGT